MSSAGAFAARVGTLARKRDEGREVAQPAPARESDSEWARIAARARCWERSGDAYFPVSEVVDQVPAGAYRCRNSQRGAYIEKMAVETDRLLRLPDGAVDALLSEFRKFWTLRKNFSDHGFTFKRGMLLWGPPGSGKTSGVWQMTQELVTNHDGIVVFVEEPELATICISLIRRIEPERPMITVMEDLDALVQRHGDHGYLALLDGETQIANVCHVATTNYPEYLDRRFVDRPSRFDTIMFVDMPSADARRAYFRAKVPAKDKATIESWVRRSDGYSIAHLREVIVAVECFEQSEDEVFGRLDEMIKSKPASDGLGGKKLNGGFLGAHQ